MSRIKVIEPEEAFGRLKEIYDDIIKKRGKLADVHKIQSLRPESIVHHMDLYLEIMFSKSELSRAEREMMAVVVSVSNACEYCQMHHAQALNHYWKSDEKISLLKKDYHRAGLSSREIALCEFARKLTIAPSSFKDEQQLEPLRNEGILDNGLLDATLVIAYFNFVNRIVLALGLEVTESEMQGYNY